MKHRHLIKIDSDGMPDHTIISTEDGTELKNVVRVDWEIDTTGRSVARLEIVGVPLHSEGRLEAIEFKCPVCDYSREHRCDDPSSDLS